jgi:hypothetical protein
MDGRPSAGGSCIEAKVSDDPPLSGFLKGLVSGPFRGLSVTQLPHLRLPQGVGGRASPLQGEPTIRAVMRGACIACDILFAFVFSLAR